MLRLYAPADSEEDVENQEEEPQDDERRRRRQRLRAECNHVRTSYLTGHRDCAGNHATMHVHCKAWTRLIPIKTRLLMPSNTWGECQRVDTWVVSGREKRLPLAAVYPLIHDGIGRICRSDTRCVLTSYLPREGSTMVYTRTVRTSCMRATPLCGWV